MRSIEQRTNAHTVEGDQAERDEAPTRRRIMRRAAGGSAAGEAASTGAQAATSWSFGDAVNAGITGGGAALPDTLRSRFESSLGTDLSGVRVHTGEGAAHAASSVDARAFATGQDIVVGAGQYAPDTTQGQWLLAHEVAHTVQQRGAASAPQMKSEISEAGDACEVEADDAATAMVLGRPATVSGTAGGINPLGWADVDRWMNSPVGRELARVVPYGELVRQGYNAVRGNNADQQQGGGGGGGGQGPNPHDAGGSTSGWDDHSTTTNNNTATGGDATGGNATGGQATGGNSTSHGGAGGNSTSHGGAGGNSTSTSQGGNSTSTSQGGNSTSQGGNSTSHGGTATGGQGGNATGGQGGQGGQGGSVTIYNNYPAPPGGTPTPAAPAAPSMPSPISVTFEHEGDASGSENAEGRLRSWCRNAFGQTAAEATPEQQARRRAVTTTHQVDVDTFASRTGSRGGNQRLTEQRVAWVRGVVNAYVNGVAVVGHAHGEGDTGGRDNVPDADSRRAQISVVPR